MRHQLVSTGQRCDSKIWRVVFGATILELEPKRLAVRVLWPSLHFYDGNNGFTAIFVLYGFQIPINFIAIHSHSFYFCILGISLTHLCNLQLNWYIHIPAISILLPNLISNRGYFKRKIYISYACNFRYHSFIQNLCKNTFDIIYLKKKVQINSI